MRTIHLILMGFLIVAVIAFILILIGFGVFSYKEKEEKAMHSFFWSENLGSIRTSEELQTELADKFSAGSDVGDVITFLRENKVKCSENLVLQPDKNNKNIRTVKFCTYIPEIFFITTKKTLVAIYHNDNKVDNISVTQKYWGP
jgi:hypothetical protein